MPLTYPPLELNTFVGNLLYPGDVHIKGDISTQGVIRIKGNLKVDGKLTINKHLDVCSAKGCVNADEIYISGEASIHARVKANSIIMSDHAVIIGGDIVANSIRLRSALIFGNTEAKVINVKGGQIRGFVDADEIINDGGLIYGDVNTINIENINGGIVMATQVKQQPSSEGSAPLRCVVEPFITLVEQLSHSPTRQPLGILIPKLSPKVSSIFRVSPFHWVKNAISTIYQFRCCLAFHTHGMTIWMSWIQYNFNQAIVINFI